MSMPPTYLKAQKRHKAGASRLAVLYSGRSASAKQQLNLLDNRLIHSDDTQASVMADQLPEALSLLPQRPLW